MTSPFTGTDELEVTRQDGAEKYFLLYSFALCGNFREDLTFDLFHETKCISICLSISAYLYYKKCNNNPRTM